MKYFINKNGNIYCGDMKLGDREATGEEILAFEKRFWPTADQLWRAAEDYYAGNIETNCSRLPKSETDAYQLGIQNFQRITAGKEPIGVTVINPDNERMLANLAWGQNIWADYYQRKIKLESGEEISLDFSDHGEKTYSLAQVLELE